MTTRLFKKITDSNLARRLITGGGWAITTKIITTLLGFAINIVVTRLLTPEDMGIFVYLQSLVLTISIVATMGMGQMAVKAIASGMAAQNFSETQTNIRNITQWGIIGVGLTGVLVACAGPYIAIPLPLILLTSTWIGLFALNSIAAEIFRGFHDIRLAMWTSAGGSLGGVITTLCLSLVLAFFWAERITLDLNATIFIVVGCTGLTTTWAIIKLIKIIRKHGLKISGWTTPPSWPFLWIAMPFLVYNLTTAISGQTGIWILRLAPSASDIALFGIALRLVYIIDIPIYLVNAVIPSTISELYYEGKTQKLEAILRGLATLTSIPAWLILILFVIKGDGILGIIFGDFYKSAQYILVLLTLGEVFNATTGSCGVVLAMTGHQKTLMNISLLSSIMGALLSLAMVKPFGAIGIAGSIATSLVVKNIATLWYTKKLTHINTLMTFKVGFQKQAGF